MKFDDDILIQFALGSLDAETSRALIKKLAVSTSLREQLQDIQATLANVPLAEPPVQASNALRELILGSIEQETCFDGFVERFANLFDLEDSQAKSLLDKIDRVARRPWKATIIPGVRILKFPGGPRVADATCGIVSVRENQLFPSHQHRSDEWLLVLQGTARDDKGHTLQAGDLLHAEPGSTHTLQTYGETPFVFAVILKKPNKWLIGRTILDYLFGKNGVGGLFKKKTET